MEPNAEISIAAGAHELQRRWRTVDPEQLVELAADLKCGSAEVHGAGPGGQVLLGPVSKPIAA